MFFLCISNGATRQVKKCKDVTQSCPGGGGKTELMSVISAAVHVNDSIKHRLINIKLLLIIASLGLTLIYHLKKQFYHLETRLNKTNNQVRSLSLPSSVSNCPEQMGWRKC